MVNLRFHFSTKSFKLKMWRCAARAPPHVAIDPATRRKRINTTTTFHPLQTQQPIAIHDLNHSTADNHPRKPHKIRQDDERIRILFLLQHEPPEHAAPSAPARGIAAQHRLRLRRPTRPHGQVHREIRRIHRSRTEARVGGAQRVPHEPRRTRR